MFKGTIIQWNKHAGKISGDNNFVYSFNRKAIEQNNQLPIERGRRVEFDADGERASTVHLLEEVVDLTKKVPKTKKQKAPTQTAAAKPTHHNQSSQSPSPRRPPNTARQQRADFLNPYNFVRNLPKDRPDDHVLGNCPPPPHDRYVGLSGTITCTVEAVTPLFISDSHATTKGEKDHYTYRFFQVDGQPALPASSLRGMIRSVFEAVTNSCFAVFEDKKLSLHYDPQKSPWLVPARVEKQGDEWKLQLLTGTTDLQIRPYNPEQYKKGPNGAQYAAWLHQYWPMKPSGTLRKDPQNGRTRRFKQSRQQGSEIDLQEISHGQECYAILESAEHAHPRIKFWDVIELGLDKEALEKKVKVNQNQKVVQGWPCLNNQNIEPKHSERFFFRDPKNRTGTDIVSLPKAVIDNYVALIKDYQDRHKKAVEKRGDSKDRPISQKEAGFSRFIYEKSARKLKEGDLVYTMLSGSPHKPQVEFIVPVSVPRVGHENTTGELLPNHLHPCTCYDKLCPACRLFGWVHASPSDEVKDRAYAGRIRFSHAMVKPETVQPYDQDITLAILASPKPTKTEFYLSSKNGQPQSGLPYDNTKAQLRGRKVYRHHPQADPQEYTRAPHNKPIKDDQNRTIQGALKSGSTFSFTLDFENLAPLELGALLWALEMEQGLHHRLGYAKPLGFGSLKLCITELEQVNWQERLDSLDQQAGWKSILDHKETLIQDFKDTMLEHYGSDFQTLIDELTALLGNQSDLPIHYPRLEAEPNPEGKNFEWFQKRKNEVLKLAVSDKGLPL